MALPEYENLTESELEMADHYAEIGDRAALHQMQRRSATRGGAEVNGNDVPYIPLPTVRKP